MHTSQAALSIIVSIILMSICMDASRSDADQIATTKDSKEVILHDDGTWTYKGATPNSITEKTYALWTTTRAYVGRIPRGVYLDDPAGQYRVTCPGATLTVGIPSGWNSAYIHRNVKFATGAKRCALYERQRASWVKSKTSKANIETFVFMKSE